MTDDDMAVLLLIATHFAQFGRVPRFGEIAATRGISEQQAVAAVDRLHDAGQLPLSYRLRPARPEVVR